MSYTRRKPETDADQIRREMSDQAAVLYEDGYTLREISEELHMDQQKIRKLLITAGVYESETADRVLQLQQEGRSLREIMAETGLSRSSVSSYLPYTKGVYKAAESSANAERIQRHRQRKASVKNLQERGDAVSLRSTLELFAGYPFYTESGQLFRYTAEDEGLRIKDTDLKINWQDVENVWQQVHEKEGKRMEGSLPQDEKRCYLLSICRRFEEY